MDLIEGVGESSSPPRSFGCFSNHDVRLDVYNRLVESRHEDALCNPEFREQLDAHFHRLPPSYGLDVNMDRVEDVLLHQKLLALAKDPKNRPVYHIRFLEHVSCRLDSNGDQEFSSNVSTSASFGEAADERVPPPHKSGTENSDKLDPCFRLEDLNLDVKNKGEDTSDRYLPEKSSRRQENSNVFIHEIIFSTIDKPKLLSKLSSLLSDIGLNIREAHVFSTNDGYSLDVFVVDGWPIEDTDGLYDAMQKAIARSEGSWSGSSGCYSYLEKSMPSLPKSGGWEIDRRLLKIGERIASGSCGDLHRGVYLGQDVAVKILRSEHLHDAVEDEFAQEVAILREVRHKNVVGFIGACTKSPHLCIVTEYMPGGSLYDYLHKNHNVLKLSQLLKFAIDVCQGMEYLHLNNIIHRDLKTANLLMDTENIVKVADFGVARFQNQEGVMTAETGTYRWMAPEVINHQPYDQKADVFSFAIVMWELVTAKIPYDSMTPLQAALGVRQGLRPDIPKSAHPNLLELMQRCWDDVPQNRPSFTEIKTELQNILKIQENGPVNDSSIPANT